MEADQIKPLLDEVKAKLNETSVRLKNVTDELDQAKHVNQLLTEIAESQSKSFALLSKL